MLKNVKYAIAFPIQSQNVDNLNQKITLSNKTVFSQTFFAQMNERVVINDKYGDL